jgi:hypothetical protein
MAAMRYLWFSLLLLICGPATAADPSQRPPCTAQNEGRFWPEEANDNPAFVRALVPYGYPEVCTLAKGHYGWRSLTVSISKLRQDAGKKRPAAGKSNPPAPRPTPEN